VVNGYKPAIAQASEGRIVARNLRGIGADIGHSSIRLNLHQLVIDIVIVAVGHHVIIIGQRHCGLVRRVRPGSDYEMFGRTNRDLGSIVVIQHAIKIGVVTAMMSNEKCAIVIGGNVGAVNGLSQTSSTRIGAGFLDGSLVNSNKGAVGLENAQGVRIAVSLVPKSQVAVGQLGHAGIAIVLVRSGADIRPWRDDRAGGIEPQKPVKIACVDIATAVALAFHRYDHFPIGNGIKIEQAVIGCARAQRRRNIRVVNLAAIGINNLDVCGSIRA
jgi:hypothetical protein